MASIVILGSAVMGGGLAVPLCDNRHDVRLVGTSLPLDHEHPDPLTRHFDGVRVPQVVRREPPPHARCLGGAAQLRADPVRQRTTIIRRSLRPSGVSPAARMTVTISTTVGGSGG